MITTEQIFLDADNASAETDWAHIEPMLHKACTLKDFTQTCTTDDIRKSIETEHSECYLFTEHDGVKVAGEMVMVVCVMTYPQTTMMEIGFAAGSNATKLFQHAFNKAKERGRYYGCDYVRVFGRKGWLKVIEDKKVSTTIWDVKL